MYKACTHCARGRLAAERLRVHPKVEPEIGWHYLSKDTCLIRPHMSFYALPVVSMITIVCKLIRHL